MVKVSMNNTVSIGYKTEVKAILENLELSALMQTGTELANDKKSQLIGKVKDIINQLVYGAEGPLATNFSHYLSDRLGYDYTYLANMFSEMLGLSIEKYIIASKITRVKELLLTSDLKLTEIAVLLHYSSAAHLSGQFKKVTQLTPSQFRDSAKIGVHCLPYQNLDKE